MNYVLAAFFYRIGRTGDTDNKEGVSVTFSEYNIL